MIISQLTFICEDCNRVKSETDVVVAHDSITVRIPEDWEYLEYEGVERFLCEDCKGKGMYDDWEAVE